MFNKKEHFKEYFIKHKERLTAYRKEWARKNKDKTRTIEANRRIRDMEKVKARKKLQYEVSKGRVIRGLCEVCKSEKTQAHHHDYQKPLDVIWLCKEHHAEIHRK